MANLDEILANAQGGQATAMLGREFGLTPRETEAAVAALLPAISAGLKRSTSTPEGLARLLAVMGEQKNLRAMYDDPDAAFAAQGKVAGNDVLSVIFGSPEVSRAVTEQAQLQSGIGSAILRKLLPVLVGMLISGMLGRKSGEAAPTSAPTPAGSNGGGLWDILEQIFRRGMSGPAGTAPAPQQGAPAPGGQPLPIPGQVPLPLPGDQPLPRSGIPPSSGPSPGEPGGQLAPGGDFLEQILRELQKAIQEGRLKPIVVQVPMPGGQLPWPVPGEQAPMPGGQAPTPSESAPPRSDIPPASRPAGAPASNDEILPGPKMQPGGGGTPGGFPGGDIFGQIIRDLLGGASGGTARNAAGLGEAIFGDRFEPGRAVDPRDIDNIQNLLDQAYGSRSPR